MGGATHRDPLDKQGGHSAGGRMGEQCTQTHYQKKKPIGLGGTKTRCTEMCSVAESRRLKTSFCTVRNVKEGGYAPLIYGSSACD